MGTKISIIQHPARWIDGAADHCSATDNFDVTTSIRPSSVGSWANLSTCGAEESLTVHGLQSTVTQDCPARSEFLQPTTVEPAGSSVPPIITTHPQDQRYVPRGATVKLKVEIRQSPREPLLYRYRWERHSDTKRKMQRGSASGAAIQSCLDTLINEIVPEVIAPALCAHRIIPASAVEKAHCAVLVRQERASELMLIVLRQVAARPHLLDTVCRILESEGVAAVESVRDEFKSHYEENKGWQDLEDAHISGASDPEVIICGVGDKDVGSYRCLVESAEGGRATSGIAFLTLREKEAHQSEYTEAGRQEHVKLHVSVSCESEEDESFTAGQMDRVYCQSSSHSWETHDQQEVEAELSESGPLHVTSIHSEKLSPISEHSLTNSKSPSSTASDPTAEDASTKTKDDLSPVDQWETPSTTIVSLLQELERNGNLDDDAVASIIELYSSHCEEDRRKIVGAVVRMKNKGLAFSAMEIAHRCCFPLDYRDEEERTLVHLSSECYNFKGLCFLLESQHIDINTADKNGNTALHTVLLKLAQVQLSQVSKTEQFDAYQIVKTLLEYGARVDRENKMKDTALHLSCLVRIPRIIELLLPRSARCLNARNKDYDTPLHVACSSGFIEAIQPLLERGAQTDALNKDGRTPLHLACLKKNARIVSILTADEHSASSAVGISDYSDNTPLHLSCMEGNATVVKFLLKLRRCRLKARNKEDKNTALHIACERNHFDIVNLLVRADSSTGFVNSANGRLETPLHIACRNGSLNTVKFLKDNGASKQFTNEDEETPLEVARKHHHEDIVHFLEGRSRGLPRRPRLLKQKYITY